MIALFITMAAASCRQESQQENSLADRAHSETPVTKPGSSEMSKPFDGRIIDHDTVRLGSGSVSQLTVDYDLPRGHHFTDEAPCKFHWRAEGPLTLGNPGRPTGERQQTAMPLVLPVQAESGIGELILDAELYFCEDGTKICQLDKVRLRVPITVTADGPNTAAITIDVETPEAF